jgi:hypothetical protein
MTTSTTNVGGWVSSDMRTYLSGTVLPLFEASTAIGPNVIQSVDKKSDGGYSDQTIKTTQDKLWLFSVEELGWTQDGDIAQYLPHAVNYVLGEGTRYEYFKEGCTDDANAQRANFDGTSLEWWLRSSCTANNENFRTVRVAGSVGNRGAGYAYGVVFGFTI